MDGCLFLIQHWISIVGATVIMEGTIDLPNAAEFQTLIARTMVRDAESGNPATFRWPLTP